MNAFLVVLTILLFTLQTLSLKLIKAHCFRQKILVNLCFTGLVSLCTFSYLYLIDSLHQMSVPSIVLGTLFGLCFTLTIIFYNLAISTGPLSFTAFFFSASMLIPALSGLLFFDEPLRLNIALGIATLLIAFYFINIASHQKKNDHAHSWILYCLLTFILNGLLGVIQKTHQYVSPSSEALHFMFIGFLSSFICYFLAYLILAFVALEPIPIYKEIKVLTSNLLPTCLLALTSGVGNILLTFLSGKVPSSFLFPCVQGSIIILITLSSVAFFKERLNLEGKVGITLGVMAIMIMNL